MIRLLRKLYSWYRPLFIGATILTIEKKHFGPSIQILSFEVNYAGYKKFHFTCFTILFSWGSHFAITFLNLNFQVIPKSKGNWQRRLQFFNRTLWMSPPKKTRL